jgi:hypothetical protein
MALGETTKKPQPTTEEAMRAIFDEIIELKLARNGGYTDSPINILPDRYWLAQIVIKAMRAEQSTTKDKCNEELDDLIAYAVLEKLKMAGYTI